MLLLVQTGVDGINVLLLWTIKKYYFKLVKLKISVTFRNLSLRFLHTYVVLPIKLWTTLCMFCCFRPAQSHLFALLFHPIIFYGFFSFLFVAFIVLYLILGCSGSPLWHVVPHCSAWAFLPAVCCLSCHTACAMLVPQSGIEPAFPASEGGFLTTGTPLSLTYLFAQTPCV